MYPDCGQEVLPGISWRSPWEPSSGEFSWNWNLVPHRCIGSQEKNLPTGYTRGTFRVPKGVYPTYASTFSNLVLEEPGMKFPKVGVNVGLVGYTPPLSPTFPTPLGPHGTTLRGQETLESKGVVGERVGEPMVRMAETHDYVPHHSTKGGGHSSQWWGTRAGTRIFSGTLYPWAVTRQLFFFPLGSNLLDWEK